MDGLFDLELRSGPEGELRALRGQAAPLDAAGLAELVRRTGEAGDDVRIVMAGGGRYEPVFAELAGLLGRDVLISPAGSEACHPSDTDVAYVDAATGQPADWVVVQPPAMATGMPGWYDTGDGVIRPRTGTVTLPLPGGLMLATRADFVARRAAAATLLPGDAELITIGVAVRSGGFVLGEYDGGHQVVDGRRLAAALAALPLYGAEVRMWITWPADLDEQEMVHRNLSAFAEASGAIVWAPDPEATTEVLDSCRDLSVTARDGGPAAWHAYPPSVGERPRFEPDADGRLSPVDDLVVLATGGVPLISVEPARRRANLTRYDEIAPRPGLFPIDLTVLPDGRWAAYFTESGSHVLGPREFQRILREAGWQGEDVQLLAGCSSAEPFRRYGGHLVEGLRADVWVLPPDARFDVVGGLARAVDRNGRPLDWERLAPHAPAPYWASKNGLLIPAAKAHPAGPPPAGPLPTTPRRAGPVPAAPHQAAPHQAGPRPAGMQPSGSHPPAWPPHRTPVVARGLVRPAVVGSAASAPVAPDPLNPLPPLRDPATGAPISTPIVADQLALPAGPAALSHPDPSPPTARPENGWAGPNGSAGPGGPSGHDLPGTPGTPGALSRVPADLLAGDLGPDDGPQPPEEDSGDVDTGPAGPLPVGRQPVLGPARSKVRHGLDWLADRPTVNKEPVELYVICATDPARAAVEGLPTPHLFAIGLLRPPASTRLDPGEHLLRVRVLDGGAVDLSSIDVHVPPTLRLLLATRGVSYVLPAGLLDRTRLLDGWTAHPGGGYAGREEFPGERRLVLRSVGARHGVQGLPVEVPRWPRAADDTAYALLPSPRVATEAGALVLLADKPRVKAGHRLLRLRVPRRRAIDVRAAARQLAGLSGVRSAAAALHDKKIQLVLPSRDYDKVSVVQLLAPSRLGWRPVPGSGGRTLAEFLAANRP